MGGVGGSVKFLKFCPCFLRRNSLFQTVLKEGGGLFLGPFLNKEFSVCHRWGLFISLPYAIFVSRAGTIFQIDNPEIKIVMKLQTSYHAPEEKEMEENNNKRQENPEERMKAAYSCSCSMQLQDMLFLTTKDCNSLIPNYRHLHVPAPLLPLLPDNQRV